MRFKGLRMVALVTIMAVIGGCAGVTVTQDPPSAANAWNMEKLVIGFVPSQEASTIPEKVKPMNAYLESYLGMKVETFVGTNYVGVIEGMGSKKVDVGFLPPLGFVLASSEHGVKSILKSVRRNSFQYRAQLVTRTEDNVPVCNMAKTPKCEDTMAALKGKKLAFIDPGSASGYLFPASFLKSAGVDIEKGKFFSDVIFAGQHPEAAKAVYNKSADAAWTFEDVRENLLKELPDIKSKLSVVAYTTPIPNDGVSVRAGLPQDLVVKIQTALLEYASTPGGKAVLKDLYTIDNFASAKDSDYDVVKAMAENMGVDLKGEMSKTR
jgi:phosphonate transport system substrate-binding protein